MKDITVCNSLNEWTYWLENGADDQIVIPQTSTIIDYDSGIYKELGVLPVLRLRHINQLGLAKTCRDSISASQTRYEHSLVFATKIDFLAQKMNLNRELAVTAAMLHDIATTPFSDSISKALKIDDQVYFTEILKESKEINDFLKKYSIPKEKLVSLVQGTDKTPLGQLVSSRDSIDIDRWSYTTSDAWHLYRLPLVNNVRYIADPFKAVKIVEDTIVFEDLNEVHNFLEARLSMFEKVYRNPQLMAKEAFLGKLAENLIEKKIIKKSELLEMVDEEFEHICLENGGELAERIFNIDGFEVYGKLNGKKEEVQEYMQKRTNQPFIVKKGFSMNPAVKTPILENKKFKPYCELEPVHAKKLTDTVTSWSCLQVYGYEDDFKLAGVVAEAEKKFGFAD